MRGGIARSIAPDRRTSSRTFAIASHVEGLRGCGLFCAARGGCAGDRVMAPMQHLLLFGGVKLGIIGILGLNLLTSEVRMDSERLRGIDVNDIISGIAAGTPGAGVIGGYCEDGFPFFHANQAMVDMLGYDDVDDLVAGIGGLVANTIHPDDMPQVTADLGDYHCEGRIYETTYRMPRKDGSWFWTVDRGEVVRAQDGRLAIISVCQDMTAFVHRQQELERRSLVNESMLGSLPGGYHRCAADEGYPFIYTSERFRDMLGWSAEELETEFGNKFLNLVHPDDRKLTVEYVHKLESHSGDRYQDSVYRLRCKGRGYRWFTDATLECEVDGSRFFQGFLSDTRRSSPSASSARKSFAWPRPRLTAPMRPRRAFCGA